MMEQPKPEQPIVVRNIRLASGAIGQRRWYLRDDPVATTFFNALSMTFPLGERFFIESVRPYRSTAPNALRQEIANFIQQEALHTRAHADLNAQVAEAGYETQAMIAYTARELKRFDDRAPIRRLGVTIALEHFTALLSHALLAEPHHLVGAPEPIRRLWHWHALEEIEHKAVAFDTFEHATQKWSAIRRWGFRAFALLEATWLFAKVLRFIIADFYRQDSHRTATARWRTVRFLLDRQGVVRAMGPGWCQWFRPGFHPWQHDDRALIAPVAAAFAAERVSLGSGV